MLKSKIQQKSGYSLQMTVALGSYNSQLLFSFEDEACLLVRLLRRSMFFSIGTLREVAFTTVFWLYN